MPEKPRHLAAISRAWAHSQEEDHDGLQVYRPAEFDFPPARGRQGFTLGSEGRLVQTRPGPDDRPAATVGRWSYVGTRLVIEPAGGPARVYEVQSVGADLLLLRPGN
ncbi:MAG: hypothetical protein ACOYEV_08495 [Candidatus Nanopelagicales bacterium]